MLGYPIHMPLEAFVERYGVILDEDLRPTTEQAPDQTGKLDAAKNTYNGATVTKARAEAIKDYVNISSAQLRSNTKDAERIRAGNTMMLYCGTWCVARKGRCHVAL